MSAPIVEPSACAWCSIEQRGHGRQYADAVGWHGWERPSQEQILARMKARRLQLAVARVGALPVPAVGERTLGVVEEELADVNLALWAGVQAYARLRLALESARRDRRELRAEVAALREERQSTNESVDDLVRERAGGRWRPRRQRRRRLRRGRGWVRWRGGWRRRSRRSRRRASTTTPCITAT